MVVINKGQQLVYIHASIYSNLILFNDSKHVLHVIFPLVTTEIIETRLALQWISSVNYSTCILFLRV